MGGSEWFQRFALTGSKFFEASLAIQLHRFLCSGNQFVASNSIPKVFFMVISNNAPADECGSLFGGQFPLSALGVEEKQKDDGTISQVEINHPSACSLSSSRRGRVNFVLK